MSAKTVLVGESPNEALIGGAAPLVLIAGPCVLEDYDLAFEIATYLKGVTKELNVPFIFKASYDKANRSSQDSYRGVGVKLGLEIFSALQANLGVSILTDVHHVKDICEVAEVVDVIQIPAFLCRQTDLIQEAASTGKPINVKKAQFMAPTDMRNVVDKIGHNKIMLTERGTCFGYHNLVVDFRSLGEMNKLGYPIVFDVTHSVQLPGGGGNISGGLPEFIFPLSRAGVAFGIDALFVEVYPNPEQAKCDGANSLALAEVPSLLKQVKGIERALMRKV